MPFVLATVQPGAIIHADEASHWDALHAKYLTKRINHSEVYSANGACTNMAESLFSRLRRAEIGTHHHIAGPYLAGYAAEMAGEKTTAASPTVSNIWRLLVPPLGHPVSRQWKG